MVVVFVMVAIIMLVIGSAGSNGRNQCNSSSSSNGIFAFVIFMCIGVMAGFNHEICHAIVIYPDATAIVVPGSALYTVCPGVLLHEADVPMGIGPAHFVLVIAAFTADSLICGYWCRYQYGANNCDTSKKFNNKFHGPLSPPLYVLNRIVLNSL